MNLPCLKQDKFLTSIGIAIVVLLFFALRAVSFPYSYLVWEGDARAYHVYYRDSFDANSSWILEAKVANSNYILSDDDKKQPQRFWAVASIGADGMDYPIVNIALATNWQRTFSKLVAPKYRP